MQFSNVSMLLVYDGVVGGLGGGGSKEFERYRISVVFGCGEAISCFVYIDDKPNYKAKSKAECIAKWQTQIEN